MWARGGTGVYAQTTANVADEGVVMHVDLAWEVEDVSTWVAQSEPHAVATWQTPISQDWQGVEVLDLQEEWVPLEPEFHQAWMRQWRSRTFKPWTWGAEGDGAQTVLRGSGSAIRFDRGEWQRLTSVKAILGASPVGSDRVTRNWPTESVRATGVWHAFATTEEGVHCLGFEVLLA